MNCFSVFRPRNLLVIPLVLSGLTCHQPIAEAQQKKFHLQLEIMAQPNVGARGQQNQWARVLQKIGRSATFRQGKQGELTRVELTKFGNRQGVLVVGILERDNTITILGKKLRQADAQQLDAMLRKLEQWGPGGPPNQNPTWGLSPDEFKAVLQLLAPRVKQRIDFTSAVAAIRSLELPKEFTIEFTKKASERRVLPAAKLGEIQPNCTGLSKGTSLAIVLAQFGLGFRPMPNPKGGYVIEVDVGDEADNMYPVGWKNTQRIFNVLPALGKTLPVDLEQGTPLDKIIELLAQKLAVHHFYSAHALLSDGKDISKLTYGRKPDKLAVNNLMRILSRAHGIAVDIPSLRTDEAGSIFLWVTTEDDSQAFSDRFKDVKPK